MEYKDLADCIFPDAKPIEYYEEKYPKRDLPEGAVVTRVAPSPTGYLHIGTLYQALVARKLASQTKGVFFLRIEDTDQKREVEDAIRITIEGLKDFQIDIDEGMISENEEKGNYGPYKQSLRKEIYQAYAKHLIEQGKAYPCFCTPEELDEIRKKQEAAGAKPGYYGVWAKCRTIPVDEAIEKIKNGEKCIIRIKSMGREDRSIKHHDLIRGNVIFPENDQDIIIIKSDGLPTYHFAHAVDDHLMHTTLAIRGEEWLSSMPIHLQLFQMLGNEPIKYAHISPIMKEEDGNKRKISKRKDPEAAVSYYSQEGIPAESVNEYLLNIANSNFEGWRKGNQLAPMDDFEFKIDKMNVSGALFDMVKMLDVSKNVISKFTPEKIYEETFDWAKKYDKELEEMLNDKEYSLKVLGIERNTNAKKPRKDISKWSEVKDNIIYMYDNKFLDNKIDYQYQKVTDKELIKKIIQTYIDKYFDINDDKETWFNKIKDLGEEFGFAREVKEYKENPDKYPLGHIGDVSTVLRVGLTGRSNTPDMYEIMKVLGKDSCEKRFNKAIENL